jgi:ABC-type uncharacterized transport system permease subunit
VGKTCLLENILFILPVMIVVVTELLLLLPPAAATAAAAVAAMIELLVGERSSDDDDGSVAAGADTVSVAAAGVVSPLVVGAILIGALRFIASDVADVDVGVDVVVVVVFVGATFSSLAVESRTERRLTIGMPPLDETSLLSLPVDDSGI